MARRRKKASLAEDLIDSPWWVSAMLAGLAYIALRWILPAFLGVHPMLSGVAVLLHSFAWMPSTVLMIFGAIAFFRSDVSVRAPHAAAPHQPNPPAPAAAPGKRQMPKPHTADAVTVAFKEVASASKTMPCWTLDSLRSLEWKRFELLCGEYYKLLGFRSETINAGADGGIDVKLFKNDPTKPLAIVQCKAWNVYQVGVKEVRELLGVMAHEKIGRGVFITTGSFSKDAADFGAANPIQMLDGPAFLNKILELKPEQLQALRLYAFSGDYTTPSCASCGIKMIRREGKRGAFWGCTNYPRCKSRFPIKL